MPKLKLGAIPDDKPVRLTITLTADLHALLVEYTEAHAKEFDRKVSPEKLVPHMLERFIRTDRAFARTRRSKPARRTQSDGVDSSDRPE
jgi:hypothetical protein